MKIQTRAFFELVFAIGLVSGAAAWASHTRDLPKHLSLSRVALQPSPVQVDSEEGPLIPQISRPIGRFAPIEYRDAFSPTMRTRRAHGSSVDLGKQISSLVSASEPRGHKMRDPFRSNVYR